MSENLNLLSINEYIDAEGYFCPSCQSKNIEGHGISSMSDQQLGQNVTCNDCEGSWIEYFNLANYDSFTREF